MTWFFSVSSRWFMVAVRSGGTSIKRFQVVLAALGLLAGFAASTSVAYAAPRLPEIRLSRQNTVPLCVTPERLMAFLQKRNGNLSPRFRDIARFYKKHGEAWNVRWDYAFFQMSIETNFLTYRAPSGRMGDVDPRQNNFAGIGTTGGGVPGDSFPDVSTGVLGQIQHLVAYSGEMVSNPVAPRTQLKQEHILEKSRQLARPVRFSDLAKRWAADPKYGGSIEWVAERFRAEYCSGKSAPPQSIPQDVEMLPWHDNAPARATGGDRASAPSAPDAGSPVRTVWRRDQKHASRQADQASAKAAAAQEKQPARKTVFSEAKVQPVAPAKAGAVAAVAAPSASDRETMPPVSAASGNDVVGALLSRHESAEQAPAEAPESSFALFTPPAALASAKPPKAPSQAAADVPKVDVLPAPAPVSELAPAQGNRVQDNPVQDSPVQDSPSQPPANYVAASTDTSPREQSASDPAAQPQASSPEAPGALASLLGAASNGGSGSKPNFDPPSGLGVKPSRCVVETARYGGETTVLVKSPQGAKVHYVALSVIDGFEDSMTKSFLSSRGQGGEVLGTFPTREQALVQARTLCPD
jgi:hypothetical protein